MSKIKEKVRGRVRTLDKSVNTVNNIKGNIISSKDKLENTYTPIEEKNEVEYASNKINNVVNVTTRKGITKLDEAGQKSVRETKQNIQKGIDKTKYIKNQIIKSKQKHLAENRIKQTTQHVSEKTSNEFLKSSAKTSGKYIKNSIKTGEKAIKTSENVVKSTQKTAKTTQKMTKIIKETAKSSAKATKETVKAVIKTIKLMIIAFKNLLYLLIAGGWISVVIIIVVCMIGFLMNSVFGIFFSNEYDENSKSMVQVISELNTEFINKITTIQQENPYEEYDIEGSRAEWKDILAVYVAKYSNGNYQTEMMSLNEEKIEEIKRIFWEMNEVSFTKEETTEQKTIIHLTWTEHTTITHTKLHIKINHKTAQEMADTYNFSDSQREQMNELLKDGYTSMWSTVIYGSNGNSDIVSVAQSQLGNVGGQPYWSWYGFNSRVEWCATFVSWCANQCGYIENGIIPKFASCESEGVAWFQACGLWQNGGYTPKPGDIIFFDWADKHDGIADHVGIVKCVENGRVYTIEGNSNDSCCEKNYDLNSNEIRGYGTPMY